MTGITINFIEISVTVFETILFFFFFDSLFVRKYTDKYIYSIVGLFSIGISNVLDKINLFENYKIFTTFLLIFSILIILYKGRTWNKLLISMILLALLAFADLATYSIDKFISGAFGNLLSDENYHRTLMLFISKTIFFILIKISSKKAINVRSNFNVGILYYTLLIAVPFISIASFLMMFYLLQFIPKEFNVFSILLLISIGILFLNLIVFYVFDVLLNTIKKERNFSLMEQQYRFQIQNFEYIKTKQNNLKSIKHDIKNHFLCISKLVEQNNIEELKNYLKNIDEKVTQTDIYSDSGNVIIDAILNEKCEQAKSNGIGCFVNVIVPKNININNDDLCIVLSNIIDNALEATSKVEKNKIIEISIEYKKEMLFIRVKNVFKDRPVEINNNMVSSKENPEFHGIGLKNVKSTIDKYNGFINIIFDESLFSVEILLCELKEKF